MRRTVFMASSSDTTVHIGENSPQRIAYVLLGHIRDVEGRIFHRSSERGETADRKWILDTYAECLDAVTGQRPRK